MELKLVRKELTNDCTIGELFVNGGFECFTLEDKVRPVKIKGETAMLVSFAFNLGAANLKQSRLLRLLNRGDFTGAANEFGRWNKSGGKVLAGLTRRRAAEAALFKRP